MGLVWSLGQNASKKPDVLVGFQSTQVKASNKVQGADLSFRLQSDKNFALEGIRLSYLGGNRNAVANLGGGYSFASSSALITAAFQAPHIRGGTDYLLASQKFAPYLEINTLKRLKPTGSNYSCPTGKTLRNVQENFGLANVNSYLMNGFPSLGIYTADQAITSSSDGAYGPFLPVGSVTCFEAASVDEETPT
jgi:hypothetical protein